MTGAVTADSAEGTTPSAPGRFTGKVCEHFEQRTDTPAGPIFSSARRNRVWHAGHWITMRRRHYRPCGPGESLLFEAAVGCRPSRDRYRHDQGLPDGRSDTTRHFGRYLRALKYDSQPHR